LCLLLGRGSVVFIGADFLPFFACKGVERAPLNRTVGTLKAQQDKKKTEMNKRSGKDLSIIMIRDG